MSGDVELPAAMVAWHGCDRAPEDWDGGPVMLRDGSAFIPRVRTPCWRWNRRNAQPSHDIIAYTPRQPAPTQDSATEREARAREVLRRECYPFDVGGERHAIAAMLAFADAERAGDTGGAEAMREAAARVANASWSPAYVTGDFGNPTKWEPASPWDRGAVDACQRIATAIRALPLSAAPTNGVA